MKRLLLAATLALSTIAPAQAAEPTAEQTFEVFYGKTNAIGGGFRVSTPETAGADARKLSPTERKKYDDRVKRAELAGIVLYGQKCKFGNDERGIWIGAIDKANYQHVKAMFDALPEDQRNEAIEHERKNIEANSDNEYRKGGWDFFCRVAYDEIIDGYYKNLVTPLPKLEAIVGRGAHEGGLSIGSTGYWSMWLHVANRSRDFYRWTKWSCSFSYKGQLVYEDTFYVEQVAARNHTNKMMTLWTNRGIDQGECRLLEAIKDHQS
jgi:hypothetical protein